MAKQDKIEHLVSVVVPLYNGEKTIKITIDSILNQTYFGFEVLVVDDGSTDGSAAIVKGFDDSRIRYFLQKNSGSPAAPRNLALKEAKGELIALCDQDDVWYPQKLEVQLADYEAIQNKNDIGVVISSADLIDGEGKVINTNPTPFSGFATAETFTRALYGGNFITTCSAIIPKKVLDTVGDFDLKQVGVDDYDLWFRIAEHYGILAVHETLCAWRYREDSLSASKARIYMETEKVFLKLEAKSVSPEMQAGHGKNLGRIFVAGLLERDPSAINYFEENFTQYPISAKVMMLYRLQQLSPEAARSIVRMMKVFGLVSL